MRQAPGISALKRHIFLKKQSGCLLSVQEILKRKLFPVQFLHYKFFISYWIKNALVLCKVCETGQEVMLNQW